MFKRILMVGALVGLMSGARAEEKSLQGQLDDLKAQVDYIKNSYEPAEPVEQVKQVTEWVSPSGELFTEEQKGDVSPTDGSPLKQRVTYRKMKFSRRELVSEKIAAAIASSVNGHVVVGLSMVGVYQNLLGTGDAIDAAGNTHSTNRGSASGQFDVTFAGKPMRDTLIVVDLNSGVGPGVDALAPNTATFNPNYLNGGGNPSVREAWVSFHTPRKNFGLQAGVIDLTNVFDGNLVANDETSQFLTGGFVNSPLLAAPANSPGAIFRADLSRWNLKLGVQDSLPTTVGMTDDVYSIAELGFIYNFFGDAQWRMWARQMPRGSGQPNQAFGLSNDHRINTHVTTFWRYSKQVYVQGGVDPSTGYAVALNTYDWSASAGFELSNLWVAHLKDRFGVGYGRNDLQNGDREDFSEVYYKSVLTPGFTVSVHGQGDFNRVRGAVGADALPNIFVLGLRTQFSY